MSLEWSVAVLLLAAALWPLARNTRSWGARTGAFLLIVVALFVGSVWKSRAHQKVVARNQLLQKLPAETRPGGYVGSETCRSCHPSQHASWHRTFHRTMTQHATSEAVRGNFTNVTLNLDGESFHLSRRGEEFFVEMVDPDWKRTRALRQEAFTRGQGPEPEPQPNPPRINKRVTMTTGSHHMQAYWVAGEIGNQQVSLPFIYLFEEQRWLPRNDVFMLPPDAPHVQQVWNDNCIACHATAGQPQRDPKTFVLNTRAAQYGIACESCHGPGEQHVRANANPFRRYATRRGTKSDPTITNPARLSARKSSEMCGQCHTARYDVDQVQWSMEGFGHGRRDDISVGRPPEKELQTFTDVAEPAVKHGSSSRHFWSDGMVRATGREYDGLIKTPCFQRGNMSCLSCHSMHKSEPDDQLARGMEGNRACYQCHSGFAKRLAQHTHHAANSAGSLCYNCHMPHTTHGLLKGIRSHQLTSPTVRSSIETGRPNACNLCHLDQTLSWTAKSLNAWYRQPVPEMDADFAQVPASVVWLLRGDAGQRALIAWHMGWAPARQASGTNWLAPYLAETLDDPYSVVRFIGRRSLKTLPGFSRFDFDYIAPVSRRIMAKSELLQSWNTATLPATEQLKVLTPQKIGQLIERRDHRVMELLE